MEKIERIKREVVCKGTIIDMYQDTVIVPNGNTAKWDFIGHNGAAAVLPITSDKKIILVKQWRNALDRFTYEIPAGGLEKGEEMINCASRELEEETGYKSDNLVFLLSLKTTVAFCNERIDVFIANNLIKTKQHLDEDERIDVCTFELEELLTMIKNGVLQDSKTVSSILAYNSFYKR